MVMIKNMKKEKNDDHRYDCDDVFLFHSSLCLKNKSKDTFFGSERETVMMTTCVRDDYGDDEKYMKKEKNDDDDDGVLLFHSSLCFQKKSKDKFRLGSERETVMLTCVKDDYGDDGKHEEGKE